MYLLLFWVKILFKRIVGIIKLSPVITIGGIMIISAFIYTRTNLIISLDARKFIMVILCLFFLSAMMSLMEYDIMGKIIFYAKSNYSNRLSRCLFFMKKAILNNVLMILFMLLCLIKKIIFNFSMVIPKILLILLGSIIISFGIISVKNNGKITNIKKIHIKLNPRIKSILCDYSSSIALVIAITALSLFIGIAYLTDMAAIKETKQSLFISLVLFLLLSVGFTGIFEAIPRTNWLFYAILSLDFKYHIKRAVLFLLSVYGLILIQYIMITAFIDIKSVFIYTFGIISTLFFSVFFAFTFGNILKKTIVWVIYMGLIICIMYINPYIMLATIIPVLFLLLKAKNDFFDWTYL